MKLAQILFRQGFGTRRHCEALVWDGRVKVGGEVIDDDQAEFDPQGLVLEVEGQRWEVHASALVLLHKPAGYECSQKPKHHPGVMTLLPPPLRQRGVQPIGRLDEDTTGLLLLTDDGPLIHRLTHPKRHVPKVYEARTARPVTDEQVQRLREGVLLVDDPVPTRPAPCERTGETALRLTLTEGRYHQVKRMIAAVGNHCEALHRSAFGTLTLGAELAPGQWRWVSDAERAALLA